MEKPIITTIEIKTGEVEHFYPTSKYIPKFWYCFPDCIRHFIDTLSDEQYVLGVGFWQTRPFENKLRLSFVQIGQTGTRQSRDADEMDTLTRELIEETGLFISRENQKDSEKITADFEKKGYTQKWYCIKTNISRVSLSTTRPESLFPPGDYTDNRKYKVGIVVHGEYKELIEKVSSAVGVGYLDLLPEKDNIGWISVINVGFLKTRKPYRM